MNKYLRFVSSIKIFLISTLFLVSSLSLNVYAAQQIKFSDSKLSVMGRTQTLENGSVLAGYPGVSFSTEFTGNTLTLNIQSSSDRTYIEAIVDEQAAQIFKLNTNASDYQVVVPAGKKHKLTVINRAESWHGLVTFNDLSTDGKFIHAIKLPKRKLLVLGDSVTCASSIDRTPNVKPDTDSANPRLSYGMLIAKELKAQVQLVCMGGHGLVRTWDGFTDRLNLEEYYALTYPSMTNKILWDQKKYQPDLILSAIGTNDFNQGIPDQEQYVNAYVTLVNHLLTDHKRAQIVLTEGAILNGDKKLALTTYIQETIKKVANTRVHYVESKWYPGEAIDAHPTKQEHAKMAEDFIPPLKKLMHW